MTEAYPEPLVFTVPSEVCVPAPDSIYAKTIGAFTNAPSEFVKTAVADTVCKAKRVLV